MSSTVSALAQNLIGFFVTISLVVFYIYFTYYTTLIDKKTFQKILDIMLHFSIVHAIYAWLEAYHILPPIDYHAMSKHFITWNDGRADSFFFNPNYYALACGFFILIAGYKMYHAKCLKKQGWYAFIAFLNGCGLLFTLTRTILPSLLISLITFGFLVESKIFRRFIIVAFILSIISVIIFYSNVPRFELNLIDEHIDIRTSIWQASIEEFCHKPFGQGPLTYMTIYEKYASYPTQHAHNMILDTLLNYGFLGASLLIALFTKLLIQLHRIKNTGLLKSLRALCMSFITLVLVSGLLDVTIFWVQTLFIFMTVCLSTTNLLKEKQNTSPSS
ncbi:MULTISPECIES: O-antigen ligase [unclassified Granulicatella]|uniref:O-antigen ligase family protein n=1 Tax=unclassified Granulicatella TaxID=2630493 RepID=UPI0013D71BEA|nr:MULTISPECIES: O-antigen ligase family protein [unclassified Granulicatella]MBS4749861.1 O-antigen ligase family protein [Carnobacteriaceae bacterium zg-ZUI78]QMI85956.1 O-antigen ligase family protein [Carnobacteriaceae bacterium zg-84]